VIDASSEDDATSGDPYLDPRSRVLRNRLGLTDPEDLRQAEADLTFVRITQLGLTAVDGDYDLTHLQAFHRFIFRDIYDWAGELRTVEIARTHMFARARFLEQAASDVFSAIAEDRLLRGLERGEFVAGAAHHLAEINALHPFREGNGRAQRAFLSQLARDAGYRIGWARMDPKENIAASAASLAGDVSGLIAMLDEIVEAR
jgi:cell filamentation protein